MHLCVTSPLSQVVQVIEKLVHEKFKAVSILPFWMHRRFVRILATSAERIWMIPTTLNFSKQAGYPPIKLGGPVWAIKLNQRGLPRDPLTSAPTGEAQKW